jgi:hypothetical protein
MNSTIRGNPALAGQRPIPFLRLLICIGGAMLVSGAAAAGNLSEAQALYKQERAACMSGQTNQDRATCLKEAGAALQAAKRGDLGNGQAPFEQNLLSRCDRQPPGDREDCLRRMKGEGTTSGTAESGGIYRELRTTVPAK